MFQLGDAWRDEVSLATQWRTSAPFPHLVIDGFSAPDLMEVLEDQGVDRYQGDLFEFEASPVGGLALAGEFATLLCPVLERVTGKVVRKADMRAYAYRPGHYLLPHTDHQDGLGRVLAYAWYLPTPEPPTGGELELFAGWESARVIEPAPWRIAIFEVGDRSLHQVREVLSGLRLSLAGWFYA
ncbi:MAG: 2OG-Fe(II) oxygenase [Kofleriaceae bacterium]